MKARSGLLLGVVLFLGAAATAPTLGQVRFASGADEGFYLHYASRVSSEGPAAFSALAREYLREPERRFYPTPVRLSTIAAQAAAMRITGASWRALQLVSLGSFLLLLAALFFGLSRLFGERVGFWAALLTAASPLHLSLARRALSDSWSAALCVISLLAFSRAWFSGSRSMRAWASVAILLATAFLAKEANILLVPLVLAPMAWRVVRHREPVPWVPFLSVSVAPLAAAILLGCAAAGGWGVFWRVVYANVTSPSLNAYAVRYGGGPWFRYFLDFLLVSPVPTLLYLGWVGYLLGARERDPQAWWWALLPVLFVFLSIPATKNLRYALMLEAPIRLGAVLLLDRVLPARDGSAAPGLRFACALLILIWLDLESFHRLFVAGEIYDPVTAFLIQGRGLAR